ncbi:MAG TPA: lipocalin-like domain-containing protein [Pseudomonadales bacterium]
MTDPRAAFYGAWRLEANVFRDEQGVETWPFGEDCRGLLMYDPSGMMSVQMIRADRPRFPSEDITGLDESLLRAAFEGLNTYFGRFEVDVAGQRVIHHVEAASLPNRAGSRQERQYELDGDRLVLRSPPRLLGGRRLTGELRWRKTGNSSHARIA